MHIKEPTHERVLLEIGANCDGYFNNEMFLTQVKEAIDVFEVLKLKVVL